MFSNRTLPLVLITFCLFAACKKETKGGGDAGIILGQHLQLSVDSLCVQAGNIITPNWDGMNDIFAVQCWNDTAFNITIRNEAGNVVFTSSDRNNVWNGIDLTVNDSVPTAGRYRYSIHVTGTSGAQLSGNYVLYVVTDPTTPCFSAQVPPVFGDQFDPRICGIAYPSTDVVCVW